MSIAPPPPGPDGISTVTAAAHTSATQTVPTPTRVASRGLVVAAGLVLVAAGVLGVLRVAAPRSGTGAGAEVPSAPASSPQASTDRAVTVVILPSDATVEIGGAAVPVRDGIIELRGPLGSIHSVMLSRGAQKAKVHVVIAESGAMPPKVELPPIPDEKVAPSASAVKPQVAPPPWPRTPPTPSAAPSAKAKPRKDPLIPERFE